jgi:hypothetical protein
LLLVDACLPAARAQPDAWRAVAESACPDSQDIGALLSLAAAASALPHEVGGGAHEGSSGGPSAFQRLLLVRLLAEGKLLGALQR